MSHPRILWVDTCGALLSAVLHRVVLPLFASELGATESALRTLGAVALGYALFDIACLLAGPGRAPFALRVTAVANFVYPALSAAVLAADGVPLRPLGLAYIALESLVVLSLGALEWRAAPARIGESKQKPVSRRA
jgi:hypothetical protein